MLYLNGIFGVCDEKAFAELQIPEGEVPRLDQGRMNLGRAREPRKTDAAVRMCAIGTHLMRSVEVPQNAPNNTYRPGQEDKEDDKARDGSTVGR